MPGSVPRPADWLRRLLSGDRPVDVAVAVAFTALNVAGAISPDAFTAYDLAVGGAPLVVMSAASGLALLCRRRYPLATFAFIAAVTYGVAALAWEPGMLPVTLLVAAYSLGAFAPVRRVALGLLTAWAGMAPLFAMDAPYFDEVLLAVGAPVQLLIAAGLGVAVARRRHRAAGAREHSLALARNGAVTIERALLAERLHLARELHDVVMNSLMAITVHAASMRRTAGGAGPVLATIEDASRAATDDLRRMLGALRTGSDEDWIDEDDEEARLRASLMRATGWTSDESGAADDRPAVDRVLPQWPIDAALGVCLVAVNVAGSVVPDPSTTVEYGDPVLPVLVVLACCPGIALVFRRGHPLAAFVVTFAAMSVVTMLGWQVGTLPGSLVIASYALGAWGAVPRGAAAMAAMCATMVLLTVVGAAPHDSAPTDLLFFLVPWVIGIAIRRRRITDERSVAEALAAERAQAAATVRALAEQRLEVARDLHDLVTHSISAVTVQAASARHQLGPGPERDALVLIEDAGRLALADLRRMLELLHDEQPAELAPAPGLGDLEALVEFHRVTHGPVRLEVDIDVEHEPASIRLTAFRLVQEALTNVARHAPGAAATVSVRSTATGVVVHVEDEGSPRRAREPSYGGHGLAGMRERVAIVGGSLTSQPTPEGGFLVRAELSRGAAP